eukprot:6186323-Prorocentrum_lima.AAC.1
MTLPGLIDTWGVNTSSRSHVLRGKRKGLAKRLRGRITQFETFDTWNTTWRSSCRLASMCIAPLPVLEGIRSQRWLRHSSSIHCEMMD